MGLVVDSCRGSMNCCFKKDEDNSFIKSQTNNNEENSDLNDEENSENTDEKECRAVSFFASEAKCERKNKYEKYAADKNSIVKDQK